MKNKKEQVVFTNKAKCRDCYRCIRVCPVKAIEMKNGQASVIEARCIDCGTCISNCPQKAKTYRKEIDGVKSLLDSGAKVAISIAPSFAGFYSDWERDRLPSALRKLGFSYIAETSIGAYYTSLETNRIIEENSNTSYIATACPAIVNYIEKYHPEKIKNLVAAASPMVAHSRLIKKQLGDDTHIVFLGPCIAKKAEADRDENRELIDYVVTFEELNDLLYDEGINLANFENSDFDDYPPQDTKLYPLTGGLLKTSGMDTSMLAGNILAVSGFEDVNDAISHIDDSSQRIFIEPLFCRQGCLNGPGADCDKNIFARREELLSYHSKHRYNKEFKFDDSLKLDSKFDEFKAVERKIHSEDEIISILEKTGNGSDENRLNCQACGYSTCSDKAVAVLEDMAEIDMCIPFMRRKAEMRNDKIIESSPNGIVIVDEHLKIINMNPAFKKYFMCSESVIGKPISYLMDPEPFVRIATKDEEIIELTIKHENYGIVCHEIIYELKNENQFVGIFVNITKNIADKSKFDDLRSQTINQARQLLKHQISMAQNIAKLLGESTAQGEALVENILKITDDPTTNSITGETDKKGWLWDMYTSK